MNTEQLRVDHHGRPKQLLMILIGLVVLCSTFIIVRTILDHLDNPGKSVVDIAMSKASRTTSKADVAKIYLWATEHVDPLNAHENERIEEGIAMSGCKPEYVNALENYLRNEGASLPQDRKKFLRDFASSIPDHIEK